MKVFQNISLLKYNTFGIDVTAKEFICIDDKTELSELKKLDFQNQKYFLLGGGSNILLTQDFDGTIIHPAFKGIEKVCEDETHVWIKVYAGEIWDDFVHFCVTNNYGGIENLSLIPGQCGTAPAQNIGAYGVEIKDTLQEVEIYNIETGDTRVLQNSDCEFGYRSSIFKSRLKHSWLITSTTYKLTLKDHKFNINYGNINVELKNFPEINLKTIREAVINIRTSKLPDPRVIGNAGSFFKNPIVSNEKAKEIRNLYPDAPTYPVSDSETKLAAGWIIEKCGWKGKRAGNTGVHDKQALVLVNYGNATGKEIIELSKEIQKSVFEKFSIHIEPEVNFL